MNRVCTPAGRAHDAIRAGVRVTKPEQMAQQLHDNPLQTRAVYGDVTKSGGYVAALAVRTSCGIVSAVLEFDTQEGVPMMILGVLQGIEEGGDPCESFKRFVANEKLVMASTMEATDTKGLAQKRREVDFDKKRAPAPDLLGID